MTQNINIENINDNISTGSLSKNTKAPP